MTETVTTDPAPCMDFHLSEDEKGLVEAAVAMFSELSTDAAVVAGEEDETAYDERIWSHLVDGGLLEAVLPSSAGGTGLGMSGLVQVLRVQGMHLARVPLATTAVAALAIASLGGPSATLAQIVAGSARVAALLPEALTRVDGASASDGFTLTGAVDFGYLAPAASHVMVTFHTLDGERVAVVPVDRIGVSLDHWRGISGQLHAAVTFIDVQIAAEELVGVGSDAAGWVRRHLLVAAAALQGGVCHEAVRRTASYVSEREQFGRPLSTNQGVAMRAADASIDSEVIELTVLDAAFGLDAACTEPGESVDAHESALVAAWWAKQAGIRVVHATQHLHGGAGADLDNHIHRFFVWAREIDILWGAADSIRDELGALVTTKDEQ